MSCCQGNCSCGKGEQTAEEKKLHLVQLNKDLGVLSGSDWLNGPGILTLGEEVVEIRFKSNRRVFYRNRIGLELKKDDRIVVEAEGGHDLGTVSLSGNLAEKGFAQQSETGDKSRLGRISRIATREDLEFWLTAKKKEYQGLVEARKISSELGLETAPRDVEFRGDGRKAIVYFAPEREADFREFLSRLSSTLGVNVELSQNHAI